MAVSLSFELAATDQGVRRAFEGLADKAEGAERALRDINDVDFARLVGSATAAALAVEREFKDAARDSSRALERVGDDISVGVDRKSGLIRRSLARAFTPDPELVAKFIHPLAGVAGTPAGLAIGAAVVAAAGPVLLTGLAVAVLGGLGAGILGIGALVAATSDSVKSKLAGAAEQIKGVFTRATRSLIAPLALAVDTLGDAVAAAEPAFTRMFAALAPSILPFVNAMVLFVQAALPGLEAALPGVAVVIDQLAKNMPALGAAFGEFFRVISENEQALRLTVDLIADVAVALIKTLGFAIRFAQAGLLYLRDGFNDLRGTVSTVMAAVSAIVGRTVAAVAGFFRRLGALPGIVGGYFARVLTAASSRLASLVATVRGIPGRILAALGNLGRLLYGAGLSLVAGLASGIAAGLGSVVDAARRVVQSAISAAWAAVVPGSPSRLMAEVGRNMAEGLAAGLQQGARLPAAQMRGLIGQLAGAGGGGGTLAGGGGVGFARPLNITVHMSNAAVGTPEQIAAGLAYALRVELLRIDRRRGPLFE